MHHHQHETLTMSQEKSKLVEPFDLRAIKSAKRILFIQYIDTCSSSSRIPKDISNRSLSRSRGSGEE
ncbi:hypothetical protein V1478_010610 [Vespula squamosa]|uniref:Uncharacterized protein n=1 Tax=Vespula squamosa TaxID=30214 RepID=A0ABD2AI88_VESSQ